MWGWESGVDDVGRGGVGREFDVGHVFLRILRFKPRIWFVGIINILEYFSAKIASFVN